MEGIPHKALDYRLRLSTAYSLLKECYFGLIAIEIPGQALIIDRFNAGRDSLPLPASFFSVFLKHSLGLKFR